MHRISTASSASTVVICTITQLCYVLVCASTKLPQLHRLAQLSPAWLAQMCLILRVSSQHFLSSVSLWNHGQVFHPIFVHVLWNYKINVTFEGLIGNYAVLSQIQSLLDLRLFCANFLSQIVRLCSFLRFLQVWVRGRVQFHPEQNVPRDFLNQIHWPLWNKGNLWNIMIFMTHCWISNKEI